MVKRMGVQYDAAFTLHDLYERSLGIGNALKSKKSKKISPPPFLVPLAPKFLVAPSFGVFFIAPLFSAPSLQISLCPLNTPHPRVLYDHFHKFIFEEGVNHPVEMRGSFSTHNFFIRITLSWLRLGDS